ncbi:MAG: thioredoxin domain-containing protein [Desulfotignum sp.]
MTTEKYKHPHKPHDRFRLLAAAAFWILLLCIYPGFAAGDTPSSEPGENQPAGMNRLSAVLDESALKQGIALRLRTARGTKDERFLQMTADHVTIEKKIPVHAGSLTVFAVKLKITPPVPDLSPEFITLMVDDTGTVQFGGIQELATGTDLAKDAVDRLQAVDASDLPADFGKLIHTGTGPHNVIVVSDPFCPHCRRGWEFIKLNLDRIHTLRLANFPLSPAAETAGLAMADAYHRQHMEFDIIDFTYTELNPSQEAVDILSQYMEAFPDLAEKWGATPETALTYLKETYLSEIKTQQQTVRALGIHSTPVFFVNNTFIKGFNSQKMEAAMP